MARDQNSGGASDAENIDSHLVSDPRDHRDRKADWLEFFDKEKLKWALEHLEQHPGIVEEYKNNPTSRKEPQSKELEMLQNYFRTHPLFGRFYIFAEEPWKKYRISILLKRGERPEIDGDDEFGSEAEAGYGVLMHRIAHIRGEL